MITEPLTYNESRMKLLGWDDLGLLHKEYPLTLAKQYFPVGAALGVLVDTTFGTDLTRINRLPYGSLRVHLLNATAVHDQNHLNKYELLNVYSKEGSTGNIRAAINKDAETRAPRLFNLLDAQLKRIDIFPKNKLMVSGLLEHTLTGKGATNVALHIKGAGFDAVDNPMSRNYPKINGVYYEGHGNNRAGLNIVSPDGTDLSDMSFYGKTPFQSAANLLEMYWSYGSNLNFSGGKVFIPPRERTTKITPYEFRYRQQMMRIAPLIPKVKGYRVLAAPNIWKPCAEDYKTPRDPRQGLPCLIHSIKTARATLFTLEGKKIKDLPYYGPFEDWGSRYYLGCTGMDHFSVYRANSNREWCLLEIGNEKSLVNIFRRTGKDRK